MNHVVQRQPSTTWTLRLLTLLFLVSLVDSTMYLIIHCPQCFFDPCKDVPASSSPTKWATRFPVGVTELQQYKTDGSNVADLCSRHLWFFLEFFFCNRSYYLRGGVFCCSRELITFVPLHTLSHCVGRDDNACIALHPVWILTDRPYCTCTDRLPLHVHCCSR